MEGVARYSAAYSKCRKQGAKPPPAPKDECASHHPLPPDDAQQTLHRMNYADEQCKGGHRRSRQRTMKRRPTHKPSSIVMAIAFAISGSSGCGKVRGAPETDAEPPISDRDVLSHSSTSGSLELPNTGPSCADSSPLIPPASRDQVLVLRIGVCVRAGLSDFGCWIMGDTARRPVVDSGNWLNVASSWNGFCGESERGPICWPGEGTSSTAVDVPPGANRLALGDRWRCAQGGDSLQCRRDEYPTWTTMPWRVSSFRMSSDAGCSLGPEGEVHCWTADFSNAIRFRHLKKLRISNWAAYKVPHGSPFRQVEVGEAAFGCGADDMKIVCWGDGVEEPTVRIEGIGSVKALAVGRNLGCASDERGRAYCWRRPQKHTEPWRAVEVPGITSTRSLSCMGSLCCALDGAGDAACWDWDSGALSYYWNMHGVRRDGPLTRFNSRLP